MRILPLLAVALVVAGCGSASGSGNKTPPTTQRQITFSHAPAMTINPQHQYSATMVTSDGTFTIGLDPKIAPITVNNFVFLARHKFYDGVVFHRILKNFMVQTGDPTGTGSGGPGYTFKDETVSQPYTRGTVAMANSGPNTNGSQFFVIVAPKRYPLPPRYTIFGGVTQGMSVVQKIADTPVAPNPGTGELSDPVNPVTLKKVTIHESA